MLENITLSEKGETMGKTILIVMVLMFVNGCGSKDSELNLKAKNSSDKKSSDINRSDINKTTIETDFVPEHVRNSSIEVVPH